MEVKGQPKKKPLNIANQKIVSDTMCAHAHQYSGLTVPIQGVDAHVCT